MLIPTSVHLRSPWIFLIAILNLRKSKETSTSKKFKRPSTTTEKSKFMSSWKMIFFQRWSRDSLKNRTPKNFKKRSKRVSKPDKTKKQNSQKSTRRPKMIPRRPSPKYLRRNSNKNLKKRCSTSSTTLNKKMKKKPLPIAKILRRSPSAKITTQLLWTFKNSKRKRNTSGKMERWIGDVWQNRKKKYIWRRR